MSIWQKSAGRTSMDLVQPCLEHDLNFGCAARNEGGVAGRNNKGLMTIDRKVEKDSYYTLSGILESKNRWYTSAVKRYAQRAGRNDTDSCIFQSAVCHTILEWSKK